MPQGFFEGYAEGIKPEVSLALKAMELKRNEDALTLQTKLATQKHGLEVAKFASELEKEQTTRTLKALTAGKENAINTGNQAAFDAFTMKEHQLLGLGNTGMNPVQNENFVPPGPPVFAMPMSKFQEQEALKKLEIAAREPRLYDTVKGYLPANQAMGLPKPPPREPEPGVDKQALLEWKANPQNAGKPITDFIKEISGIKQSVKTGGLELTPEAIEIEGIKFATTGQMPAMGMSSSPVRLQIINAAAKHLKEQGIDPKNVPAVQAEFKAVSQAFKSVKTPLANFQAFENALIKNADYALSLSGENYRTQMPPVNTILNAIKTGAGDPKIVKFGAAIYAAAMEYEKIRTAGTNITSAELSVGAQQKAEQIMNKAQTHKQLGAVIEAMKVDAKNVVSARRDQLNSLSNEMRNMENIFGVKSESQPNKPKFTIEKVE